MNLLKPKFFTYINSFRTHYYKPFHYDDHYYGKFEYHDRNKYPRKLSSDKKVDLLGEVHDIRNAEIVPSPFHIVRRIHSIYNQPWHIKVTLRRLNLHSSYNGDCVIVPNTPQFNSLILKVKHLVTLKPAIFEDGKLPEESDIGALKVCPFTGHVIKDERLRLNSSNLYQGKPELFRGNMLRSRINHFSNFPFGTVT